MLSRIRSKSLLNKVGSEDDLNTLIKQFLKNSKTLGIPAGDNSACPKTFLSALEKQLAKVDSRVRMTLLTTGPAPPSEEDILTSPNVEGRKYGQLASRKLRDAVNEGVVSFVETRIGLPTYQLRNIFREKLDLAVLEIVGIDKEGNIVPSTTLLDAPSYVTLADKVILEVNRDIPSELEGIHDVYLIDGPPNRKPIPIVSVNDRIGTTSIPISPDKIALIIESSAPDIYVHPRNVDSDSEMIAGRLLDFLRNETKHGRLPADLLPLQFGIGMIPTAFIRELAKSTLNNLEIFSGAVEDGVLDLIDADKIKGISTGALYFSGQAFSRFFAHLSRYKSHMVIRPAELSNCPELISRLGVIAVNGAVEVDIYGHVNSTHAFGSRIIGGIGGSCDFLWDAYLSIASLKSTAADGRISTIVPMVTHVDHSEHAIDVVATEQGIADLRGLTPVERARAIIANCAHPDYKAILTDYLRKAIEKAGGHEPHLLREAFSFHNRFTDKGSMLS